MKGFTSFLAEAKNTHMEHIEDNILNAGVDGARQSLNFLRAIRDMLSGNSKSSVNISVKWDGAPAIFAGIDPSDGKFFVAKKGIFNIESSAKVEAPALVMHKFAFWKIEIEFFSKLKILFSIPYFE